MKKTLRFLALALILVMTVCALTACPSPDNGGGTTTPTTPNGNQPTGDKYAAIAGEYYLDAAELGMPMAWYVKVTADGSFTIANKRDYSVAGNIKGEGTIGDKDGTYMFIYKEHTSDAPKTATFTVDKGGNLVFSTSVPIGAASISPNTEGETAIYPIAKIIGAEEHLGTYMGEYLKESPMAGNVLYSYELKLDYGYAYTFVSSFQMMGQTFDWTETGIFAIDGTKITFTSDAEGATPVEGSIAEKKITASFKLSQMASAPQEITAEFAPYADVAGTYSSEKSMMGASFYTFLTLKGNGDYTYVAYADGEETATHTDAGKFTLDGTTITLTSSTEGVAAITGTLENYTISGDNFKIPLYTGTPAAKQVFYAEHAQGSFRATATPEESDVEYGAILRIVGNRFQLAVGTVDAASPNYVVEGTFEIVKAMGAITMNMTVTTENALFQTATAAVSKDGINVELLFDPDDSAKLGFQFEQDATLYDLIVAGTTVPNPGPDMGGSETPDMGGMN